MTEFTNKSFEYTYLVADCEYKMNVLIVSAPEDIEISNIDTEEASGFIFKIAVSTEPHISPEYFETAKQYVFVFGKESEHRFGYLENGNLVEPVQNPLIKVLILNIQQILMIAGNKGHFSV